MSAFIHTLKMILYLLYVICSEDHNSAGYDILSAFGDFEINESHFSNIIDTIFDSEINEIINNALANITTESVSLIQEIPIQNDESINLITLKENTIKTAKPLLYPYIDQVKYELTEYNDVSLRIKSIHKKSKSQHTRRYSPYKKINGMYSKSKSPNLSNKTTYTTLYPESNIAIDNLKNNRNIASTQTKKSALSHASSNINLNEVASNHRINYTGLEILQNNTYQSDNKEVVFKRMIFSVNDSSVYISENTNGKLFDYIIIKSTRNNHIQFKMKFFLNRFYHLDYASETEMVKSRIIDLIGDDHGILEFENTYSTTSDGILSFIPDRKNRQSFAFTKTISDIRKTLLDYKERIRLEKDITKRYELFSECIINTLLFEHPVHQYYVLKTELWNLQIYMPELYFYIIWKLENMTKERTNISDMLQDFSTEFSYVYNLLLSYYELQNENNKARIIIKNAVLRQHIQIYRDAIYLCLKKYHNSTLVYLFYHYGMERRSANETITSNIMFIMAFPAKFSPLTYYFYNDTANYTINIFQKFDCDLNDIIETKLHFFRLFQTVVNYLETSKIHHTKVIKTRSILRPLQSCVVLMTFTVGSDIMRIQILSRIDIYRFFHNTISNIILN